MIIMINKTDTETNKNKTKTKHFQTIQTKPKQENLTN